MLHVKASEATCLFSRLWNSWPSEERSSSCSGVIYFWTDPAFRTCLGKLEENEQGDLAVTTCPHPAATDLVYAEILRQ